MKNDRTRFESEEKVIAFSMVKPFLFPQDDFFSRSDYCIAKEANRFAIYVIDLF